MFMWRFHILIFATKVVANIKIKKATNTSEKTRTSCYEDKDIHCNQLNNYPTRGLKS